MTTVWQDIDRDEAFVEHDRRMKMFSKSHPSCVRSKLSRRDLMNKIWPELVIDAIRETGGSRRHVEASEWSFSL